MCEQLAVRRPREDSMFFQMKDVIVICEKVGILTTIFFDTDENGFRLFRSVE